MRVLWWLLAFFAAPLVLWMSDEQVEKLLKRATLRPPRDHDR